jgi:Xaa-Pro aminopeptidase
MVVTMRDLVGRAFRADSPAHGSTVPPQRECMIHSIGLEEESPSVAYPIDPQPNPDRVLQEGMLFVVELYAGEVGGRDGVKLGDQVLVTGDGVKVLAPYPFCDALL